MTYCPCLMSLFPLSNQAPCGKDLQVAQSGLSASGG